MSNVMFKPDCVVLSRDGAWLGMYLNHHVSDVMENHGIVKESYDRVVDAEGRLRKVVSTIVPLKNHKDIRPNLNGFY